MDSNKALYKVLTEDATILFNYLVDGGEGLCVGFTLGIEMSKQFPEETSKLFEQWKKDGMPEFSSATKERLIANLMNETIFD